MDIGNSSIKREGGKSLINMNGSYPLSLGSEIQRVMEGLTTGPKYLRSHQ